MKESELKEIYNYISQNVSEGIHAIDKHGKTIIYNSKMKKLKGIENQETQYFKSEISESYIYHVLQTKEEMKNIKQTIWNQLGEEVVVLLDVKPIWLDGEFIGVVEFVKDITSRDLLAYQPLRRYGQPLTFEIITAVSDKMRKVINKAKMVSANREPVLLFGESGTGKDMVAEGIHHELTPKNDQFITLLCRNDEEVLLEKLEVLLLANESLTLFCERIEYLTLHTQQKIVDVFKGNDSQHTFIASVGEDPIELIEKGELLKELYYFFAAVTIEVPSLRERKEDIMPFVDDYFLRYKQDTGHNIKGLSSKVERLFLEYNWPGNLKELEVLLDELTTTLLNENIIEYDMLPAHFRWKIQNEKLEEKSQKTFLENASQEIQPLQSFIQEAEEYYINNVLEMFEGNISKTAKALGLSRQSLQYRLKKYKQ